jgi:hypothetical protein
MLEPGRKRYPLSLLVLCSVVETHHLTPAHACAILYDALSTPPKKQLSSNEPKSLNSCEFACEKKLNVTIYSKLYYSDIYLLELSKLERDIEKSDQKSSLIFAKNGT